MIMMRLNDRDNKSWYDHWNDWIEDERNDPPS